MFSKVSLTEHRALLELPAHLAGLLGVPRGTVEVLEAPSQVDLLLSAAGKVFLVEYKVQASTGKALEAVKQLRRYLTLDGIPDGTIPVVAVPYMGDTGREICAREGMSWIDLSGNAHIEAPGLRIILGGCPNRYKQPGRPSNAFAPKSSRVTRCVLADLERHLTQQEIARETGLGDGYVSRIVRRLVDDGLLAHDDGGGVFAPDPDALLIAWKARYDFPRHHLVRGHVSTQTAEALQIRVAGVLANLVGEERYAATGLAAAWRYAPFARYRVVSFYVDGVSQVEVEEALSEEGYRPEPRGANLWLLFPSDPGVLYASEVRKNLRCVSPVQVYLDLHHHPERSKEAAEALRKQHLLWIHHGD